jgi:hypothetical protein
VTGITNATSGIIRINTTARAYSSGSKYPKNQVPNNTSYLAWQISALCDMTAGDTCYISIQTGGEATDVNDIYGTNSPQTYFSGNLVC